MIRRFLTRILMVVLIAFCGYNWLEIQTLHSQVKDLQARLDVREHKPQAQKDFQTKLMTLQAEMNRLQQQSIALWRRADARTGRGSR